MTKTEPQGLATPWPDKRKWEVTRRLLAAWRWHHEYGPANPATINAYNSVQRRAAEVGADVLERDDDMRQLAKRLLQLDDLV